MKKQNLFLCFGMIGILLLIFSANNIISHIYTYNIARAELGHIVTSQAEIDKLKNILKNSILQQVFSCILPLIFTITCFIVSKIFNSIESKPMSKAEIIRYNKSQIISDNYDKNTALKSIDRNADVRNSKLNNRKQ